MTSHSPVPYQFEYADNQPNPHPLHGSLPYLPQDDHARPAFFSYSPDVVKHRKRTSRSQRKVLEEAFRQNPKPSQYTRKLLIHQTGMDRRSLQVWFQNRRAKEKKVAAKANGASLESDPSLQESQALDSPVEPYDPDADPPDLTSPVNCSADGAQLFQLPTDKDKPISPITSELFINSKLSYESTPGRNIRALHPPDLPSNARRGSAPAPLGVQGMPPAVAVHSFETRQSGGSVPISIYPLTTTFSPSTADDAYALRRASLPSSYLGQGNRNVSHHLPPIPSDPNIRTTSLEKSRLRLSSHPYAWQVASAHTSLPDFGLVGQPPLHSAHSLNGMEDPLRFVNSPMESERLHTPNSYVTMPTAPNSYLTPWNTLEPVQSRPRYSLPQLTMVNQPAPSEILPGPLPQPGYSFGTAPAPIPENDTDFKYYDEREDRAPQYRESQYLPRFGSLASAISTDSSVSSALYSEGQNDALSSDDQYQIPGVWQPDRRASCPAPFMSSFSSLAVSAPSDHVNRGQPMPGLQLLPMTDTAHDPDEVINKGYSGQDEGYNLSPPSSKQSSSGNGSSSIGVEYEGLASYRKSPHPEENGQREWPKYR